MSECQIILLGDCLQYGGIYAGDASVCSSEGTCPEDYLNGACCLSNDCIEATVKICTSLDGLFQGINTVCIDIDIPCSTLPSVGACCNSTVACALMPVNECTAVGGTYMGNGTFCNEDTTCYNAGACCNGTDSCEITLLIDCIEFGGTYMGDASFCNDDGTCYNAGACCNGTDSCQITQLDDCIEYGGTYMGDGSVCKDDGTCFNSGACCIAWNDSCWETFEEDCLDAGGTYAGDQMPCNSKGGCPDEYSSGACCIGGGCLNMPLMTCETFDGIYQGNNSFCEDNNIECVEGCVGDLNANGEVDIDDLLLLISAWGACP
jgi:hypothetical protein